jgi:hypothetical protein
MWLGLDGAAPVDDRSVGVVLFVHLRFPSHDSVMMSQ